MSPAAEVLIADLVPKREEVLHSAIADAFSPLASHDQMVLHLISLLLEVVFVSFKPPEQAYLVMD